MFIISYTTQNQFHSVLLKTCLHSSRPDRAPRLPACSALASSWPALPTASARACPARPERMGGGPATGSAAGQIVAAGGLPPPDKLAEDPPAKARVRQLATAGAFHTHFMASATDGYASAVQKVATAQSLRPNTTLLSNVDGQPVASAADAMSKLVSQLTRPVRWDLCTETMPHINVTALVEF